MAESAIPDLPTQKQKITALSQQPLQKGDPWCLVDTRWYSQWKKYVGFDSWDLSASSHASNNPGPIDNANLFVAETEPWQLKERLMDELDYVLVPQKGWELLVSWYGVAGQQPPIVRNVVENGMYVKNCKVEVYLVDFKLSQTNDVDNFVTKSFSKAATLEVIEAEMKKLFNIPDNKETRLWNKFVSNTFEHLGKREITVQDAGLYQGQLLVIEPRNDDGTWPRGESDRDNDDSAIPSPPPPPREPPKETRTLPDSGGGVFGRTNLNGPQDNYFAGSYPSATSGYFGNTASKRVPGLCGLSNLGNTCFMNSALQCLSNVSLLTTYILRDQWVNELNYDNPLGMNGQIAKTYAELIKTIWQSNCSSTIPRNFKMAVGRFAPQFSGYQQQDSQELMAFLLDGLHEDLNRILKKPYVEVKDGGGRPDHEVAAESWSNYLKRNSSIIVDIFHGLLKSTLVCPDCSKISVTFDPFCYLSLPLPMKKERQIDVFFISADPNQRIVQYKLTVPKMGYVEDLCEALSRFTRTPHENMIVTDVYNHRFHKVYNHRDPLTQILDRDDIFVYETITEDSNVSMVPLYWREKRNVSRFNSASVQFTLFGHPLLIPVPKKGFTSRILYQAVLERTKRYIRPPSYAQSVSEGSTNGTSNGATDSDEEFRAEEDRIGPDADCDEDSRAEVDQAFEKHEGKKEPSPTSVAPLFSFSCVNSYGSTDLNQLPINDKPLQLAPHTYVAADWSVKMKDACYDSKEAEEFDQHDSFKKPNIIKKQVVQLAECLELFSSRETLGVDDLWYCPACKKHQQATKKFDVWSLPRVLVIHLKRFSYNKYWRDKIDALVEFPLTGLDMSKYVNDPTQKTERNCFYDLIGVSNHFGGMGGGHYTAYAKNMTDGKWYYFDDSSVSAADEESVCSKAAYVLFYQRRDVRCDVQLPGFPPLNANANNPNAVANHAVRASGRIRNGDSNGIRSEAMSNGGDSSSATSSSSMVLSNGSLASTPNGTNDSDDDDMETN